jgi:hypothetical protein
MQQVFACLDLLSQSEPVAMLQAAQAIDWEQAELGMAAAGASDDEEDEEQDQGADQSVSYVMI